MERVAEAGGRPLPVTPGSGTSGAGRAPRRLARLLPLIKAAVSVGLIVWLARSFDWRAVGAALRALPWHSPALAALAVLAGYLLFALRLRFLLAAQSVPFTYGTLLRVSFTGLFLGNLLPSSMGGDAVKLGLLLRAHPGRKGRITLSIVADRFANMLATFLLLAAAIAIPGLLSPGLAPPPAAVRATWAGLAIGPVLVAAAAVWLRRFVHGGRLAHGPGEGLRYRLLHLAHGVLKALMNWVAAPAAVAAALALSLGSTLLFFTASLLVAAGVGIAVRPADWFFVQCLLSIAAILPISLNGLGVQEVGGVYLLGRLGVPPELAIAYALLNRVLFVCTTIPGAWVWLAGGRERGVTP